MNFLNIFPTREVSIVNVVGLSRGLFPAWNPILAYLKPYMTCGRLLLKGKIKGMGVPIRILSCYAP